VLEVGQCAPALASQKVAGARQGAAGESLAEGTEGHDRLDNQQIETDNQRTEPAWRHRQLLVMVRAGAPPTPL